MICPDCGENGPSGSLREFAEWLFEHVRRFEHPHARYLTLKISYHSADIAQWHSFTIRLTRKTRKVQLHMADLTVHDSDAPATASVTLTDAAGNPTTADQTPVWAEDSNGTVLTLAAAADGMSATLTWVAPGTANITFSTTDTDGTQIIATGSVEVGAGEARQAQMTFTPGASAPAAAPADPTAAPADPAAQ